MNLEDISVHEIGRMGPKDFRRSMARVLEVQYQYRKEYAILGYTPASEAAYAIHETKEHMIGVGGGNGSSKTESCLAEIVMNATGMYPAYLRERVDVVDEKFRGPIQCRVVVASITTTLHNVILKKLRWDHWTGVDEPGGARGHWGWIPKNCLVGGSWLTAWSEKLRTLSVLCRHPDKPDKVLGISTIQFMSSEQDSSFFASGDFHIVLHDEPPTHAIWLENQARTMRVKGRMMLAMTWPDDPSIPVDWLFDDVYEPGCDGPKKHPEKIWINLFTTDNVHLDQSGIINQMSQWSQEMINVRIKGQPIRFSGQIHPLFTNQAQSWCFACADTTSAVGGYCDRCSGKDLVSFCHTGEFEVDRWPCIFALDPHPRKPHTMAWFAIDPADDVWQVAELEVDGDATDVKIEVDKLEIALGLNVRMRIMDPRMGAQPTAKRETNWQKEFYNAGLNCDMADSHDSGRKAFNTFLKPDPHTRRPRAMVHERCANTIYQIKRYVWDEHANRLEKDLKEKAREKYDDYPALWRYVMNVKATFDFLDRGHQVFKKRKSHGKTRRSSPKASRKGPTTKLNRDGRARRRR